MIYTSITYKPYRLARLECIIYYFKVNERKPE